MNKKEYLLCFKTSSGEIHEDSVYLFGADKEKQAEKELKNKYRGRGMKIEIISCEMVG